jgi:hypothetical protein
LFLERERRIEPEFDIIPFQLHQFGGLEREVLAQRG